MNTSDPIRHTARQPAPAILYLIALLTLLSLAGPTALADELLLTDGSRLTGELIDRGPHVLTFDVIAGGVRIRRYFMATDIVEVIDTSITQPESEEGADSETTVTTDTGDELTIDGGILGGADNADLLEPAPTQPAAATTRYTVIPLHGEVGTEITAELLEACLDSASHADASLVILEINSPGGYVHELQRLVDVLINWQAANSHIPVAVLIEEAYSAAAMLAMVVPTIYMKPGSVIGAAMVIQPDDEGKFSAVGDDDDDAVGKKRVSAIWAKARAAAEAGGYNPLLVQAMMDIDLEIWLAYDGDGHPVILPAEAVDNGRVVDHYAATLVETGGSADATSQGAPIPPQRLSADGKLLTLTASQAVECGLAKAIVGDTAEAIEHLGYAGAHDDSDNAELLTMRHVRQIERTEKEYRRLKDFLANRLDWSNEPSQPKLRELLSRRRDLLAAQQAITRIIKLAKEHHWIARKASDDFDSITAFDVLRALNKALEDLDERITDKKENLRRAKKYQ